MRRIEAELPAYGAVVISAFILVYMILVIGSFTIGILLPSMSKELNLSPVQQGWLGSSTMMASVVLGIPLSWWLSKWNAKLLTLVVMGIAALSTFIQALAPTFVILLMARILFGGSIITLQPARSMVVRQWTSPKHIIGVNGAISGLVAWGVGVGLILTPFVLGGLGGDWRKALYVFGFIIVAVALIWLVLGKTRTVSEPKVSLQAPGGSPLGVLLRNPQLWLGGLIGLSAEAVGIAFLTFLPTYLLEEQAISLKVSGSLLGLYYILLGGSTFLVSFFAVRYLDRRLIFFLSGLLLGGGGFALLTTDSIPLLVLYVFVAGLGSGIWGIIQSIPFEIPGIKPREVVIAYTFVEICIWSGGILGPVIVGFLQEATQSLFVALATITAFSIFMLLGSLFLPVPQARPQPANGA